MANYTIILDGDVFASKRLRQQIENSTIIVADGGMRHIKKFNQDKDNKICPQFWIGDFDSAQSCLQKDYAYIEKITYPIEKDKTDGQLAVELALQKGARNIILCGAMGGERSDHALFHFTYALKLAEKSYNIMLTSGMEEAYPIIKGDYQFHLPVGANLSIIPLSDLKGLTLTGVKWPLDNKNIKFGSSWTLSNKVHTTINLSLQQGKAIVLAYLPK